MRHPFIIGLWLLSGCTVFLDSTPVECGHSLECPLNEVCNEGRCVAHSLDMDVIIDAGMDDAVSVVDGATDSSRVSPLFPNGECFEGQNGAVIGNATSDQIPAGYCSKWGLIWTEGEAQGQALVGRDPHNEADQWRVSQVSGAVALGTRSLFVARYHERESAINIWRQDLTGVGGEYIKPSSRDQKRPSRGDGFTAFTETNTAGEQSVFVHFDDGTIQSCALGGREQRGAVSGSEWVAWVEYRPGARVGRVVVAPAGDCANPAVRRERVLTGEIPSALGLHRAGDILVWLVRPSTGFNELRVWAHSKRQTEPRTYPLRQSAGNPVEIAAHADHVSLIHYRDISPRFTLEVVNLNEDRVRPISATGNVHQPTLSERYVMWAQGSGAAGWEVRYEALD
jgi:hypothetical protein